MATISKKINLAAYIGIILLYVKLVFVEPVFVFSGLPVTLSFILLVFVLLRVVYKLIIRKRSKDYGNEKSATLFWIFMLISTISSFFLSPNITPKVITVNVQLFLVYLLFVDFKNLKLDQKGLNKVIKALVYYALVNAFLVFYTFFFGKIGTLGEVSGNTTGLTRAFGLMGDQVAWFLTFFAVHALYTSKKYHFIIFLAAILMCASVGATVILIISSLVYFIKEKGAKSTFYLKGGIFILVMILLIMLFPSLFGKIGILQRFDQGDFKGKDAQTTGQRYNAIVNATESIQEKPLWGYQNYALAMIEKYDKMLLDSEKGDLGYLASPNNQLLVVICDYGLIGAVLFIMFIYGWLKIVRKKCLDAPPYLNAFKKCSINWLIVFFIFNQSATWFLPSSFLLVLLCLIVAINHKINQFYAVR